MNNTSLTDEGPNQFVTNIGDEPLKVYAIYGPPEHSPGTDHVTKAEADADEHHH